MACGSLLSQPGIEPTPPALEARSLNHWTAREVQNLVLNTRSVLSKAYVLLLILKFLILKHFKQKKQLK